MIHTRICDLLGIVHPIVLGGMGTATTAPLVAAVSNAGGFGTLGTSAFNAANWVTFDPSGSFGMAPETTKSLVNFPLIFSVLYCS